MSFNFQGIRDFINFPGQSYFVLFCNLNKDITTASPSEIFASEVNGVDRIQVSPDTTTNQQAKTKILSFPSVIAVATAPEVVNSVIIVDESIQFAGQGSFILAQHQFDPVSILPENPIRFNLNKVILQFN